MGDNSVNRSVWVARIDQICDARLAGNIWKSSYIALRMPHAITMRHATPHFAHVFAGDGYSSGYYSYMWSEVMDADAFEAFREAGDAFDTETAKSLEENILSTGGSREAEALYTSFRGRMPGVEALLKGRGLAA